MTYAQAGVICPRCGSAANVHSIRELADMARVQLGQLNQMTGNQPGPQGPAGPGGPGGPQAQAQGWAADPVSHGSPAPGWAQEPVPQGPGNRWGSRRGPGPVNRRDNWNSGDIVEDVGGAVAGALFGAAAKFIGRKIVDQVQTAAAGAGQALANQGRERANTMIAIADRHPDLHSCASDNVVFVAGGQRFEPMPDLRQQITLADADALVARLRS